MRRRRLFTCRLRLRGPYQLSRLGCRHRCLRRCHPRRRPNTAVGVSLSYDTARFNVRVRFNVSVMLVYCTCHVCTLWLDHVGRLYSLLVRVVRERVGTSGERNPGGGGNTFGPPLFSPIFHHG